MLLPSADLRKLREKAGLTQGQLADLLGLSQSQVSRYEQDPDNVPLKIARAWDEACGQVSSGQGISVGTPYADLERRLRLIEDYSETSPALLNGRVPGAAPDAAAFVRRARRLGRKPRVAVCGKFDAGKSRLANTLMGVDHLPASYTPTTSIICLIRHVQDRPKWQREDVWIMREGFDLDQVDSEEHCTKYRLLSGSFDTLRQFGAYENGDFEGGPKSTEFGTAFAALVYIDAPVLLGCDLIDLPGYGNTSADSRKARFVTEEADVVVYASQARGFLASDDMVYLTGALKLLPSIETDENGLTPLPNLFVVATHADASISDSDLSKILDVGAQRAHRHLEAILEIRGKHTGCRVTSEALRKRFFTFFVEDPDRREAFQSDLAGLLKSGYPGIVRARLDRAVQEAKLTAKKFCVDWISQLSTALEEQDRVQAEIAALDEGEGARRARLEVSRTKILEAIGRNRTDTRSFIEKLRKETAEQQVEQLIRSRYDNRKEAQELAASYLSEELQQKLDAFLAARAEGLVPEIDKLLTDYNPIAGTNGRSSAGGVSVPFDAQGAFMGALAASGTAGALAAWAAIATAGSNLGAYLLIPQVVGFLASLGIGVGGTASAVSLVSAIGGPFTILIGLAILAGFMAFALFGSSWQSRLAKRIVQVLEDKKFFQQLGEHADKYWNDTQIAFEAAVAGTERDYAKHIERLRRMVTTTSREELEAIIRLLEETRDFFGNMPWKPGESASAKRASGDA